MRSTRDKIYAMSAHAERGYRSISVSTDVIDFNPWNPNRQDDETFSKVKASLVAYGMVDLPQVRQRPGGRFEVINGEHRVRAARALGWEIVPVLDLGDVPDQVAKKLTILTNELRGAPEPVLMSRLIRDLSQEEGLPALAAELPMAVSELEALSKLTEAFDWRAVEATLPDASGEPTTPKAPNLGGERRFQLATVKDSIPAALARALLAEYNRSASAVGSMTAEVVLADWLTRLGQTVDDTTSRAAARSEKATAPQTPRAKRAAKSPAVSS